MISTLSSDGQTRLGRDMSMKFFYFLLRLELLLSYPSMPYTHAFDRS